MILISKKKKVKVKQKKRKLTESKRKKSMKVKNLVVIGSVEAKKFEQGVTGYLNKTTGRWQDQYPICLKCGKDFSDDVRVSKEIYDVIEEGRTYAFLGAYDNTGRYPSTDIELVGFAVQNSLVNGDTFAIIPQSEYNSLVVGGKSSNKVDK